MTRVTNILPLNLSRQNILHYFALILTLLIALVVRMVSFRWGVYLSEFDPYWHYRCAEYIANNGLFAFFNWHDTMSWYPYGRDAAASSPPGLPLTAAVIFQLLNIIGVKTSLLDVTIHFPPVAGMITVLSVYLITALVVNRNAGLLASLFLALSGGHIERTYFGFFKHETIGVFLIVLSTLFFIKAINKESSLRSSIIFSILAGLTYGYLAISWTAYIFDIALFTATSILLIILHGNYRNLTVSYIITMSLGTLIGLSVPRPGLSMVTSVTFIPVLVLSIYLSLDFILTQKTSILNRLRIRREFILLSIIPILLLFAYLSIYTGLFGGLIKKLYAILNPASRLYIPIVESVAEHKVSTWFSLFQDHGFLLLLGLLASFLNFLHPDEGKITVTLGFLLSIYFASTMVRIGLILAPFVAILGAQGIHELISLAKSVLSYKPKIRIKKKRRLPTEKSEKYSTYIVVSIVLLILSFSYISISLAKPRIGTPVSIAGASLYQTYAPDWLEALGWLRDNTPPGSVILSWWDYGYWITGVGDRPSLADNATINSTQIAVIGRIFMGNDTLALPLLKKYNVSYILVFSPIGWDIGAWGGEEVKWIWMAEIGYNIPIAGENIYHNLTLQRFGDKNLFTELVNLGVYDRWGGRQNYQRVVRWLPRRDTLLTRIMIEGVFGNNYPQVKNLVSLGNHFTIVWRSSGKIWFDSLNDYIAYNIPMVVICKVNYNVTYGPFQISTSSSRSNISYNTNSSLPYITHYIGDNWGVSVNITSVFVEMGAAKEGGPLNASASILFKFLDKNILSIPATIGLHTFEIREKNDNIVILHLLNGQPIDVYQIDRKDVSGDLQFAIYVEAENSPNEIIKPATASVSCSQLSFYPITKPISP